MGLVLPKEKHGYNPLATFTRTTERRMNMDDKIPPFEILMMGIVFGIIIGVFLAEMFL